MNIGMWREPSQTRRKIAANSIATAPVPTAHAISVNQPRRRRAELSVGGTAVAGSATLAETSVTASIVLDDVRPRAAHMILA